MKGYNKYIVEALKKMQGGEELEMGAENCRELDQAKRDVKTASRTLSSLPRLSSKRQRQCKMFIKNQRYKPFKMFGRA